MKPVLCALGAFLVIALSIPTQLVLLALFPGVLGVVLVIVLGIISGAAGSYGVWTIFEYVEWRKARKHGRV